MAPGSSRTRTPRRRQAHDTEKDHQHHGDGPKARDHLNEFCLHTKNSRLQRNLCIALSAE